jgi:rod shape-determining protein MreC
VVAVIALSALIFRGSAARALGFFQRPLVDAGTWMANKTFGLFDAAAVSPERLGELESRQAELAIDLAELERLRTENAELRSQLNFFDRRPYGHVTASIISRSVGPEASVVIIDRGSDDGVAAGWPVIAGDGIMVGKVVAVSGATATVRTLSDRSSATAVTLLNGTRTIGIAEGMSGVLLALRYIPQDERISVNDIVVTSGLEDAVPSGLVVGIVNSVSTDPTAPFQEAVLEPLSDIRRLTVVSVIIPETQ